MKPKELTSSLKYKFEQRKKFFGLDYVIKDKKDPLLAIYVLEQHPEQCGDSMRLGWALQYAAVNAGENKKHWVQVAELIHQHPNAAGISSGMISSCMVSATANKNIEFMKELLCFPQIPLIDSSSWNPILLDCLPKGDPEKLLLDPRRQDFEDEGSPEILKLVRAAMKQHNIPPFRYPTPPSL